MRASQALQRASASNPAYKTYYVDPAGSDSNNGLSTGSPFATPAAALAVAREGSTVLLKRQGIWTPEVHITTPRLTLGAYGTGAYPVIDRGTEPTGGIFNDGFESETTSFNTNWGGKTQTSSTATVETTSPLRGAKSLKCTHASGGSAYVTKTLTAASEVYFQFKVKINTLVTAASDYGELRIFTILGGYGNVFLSQDLTPDRRGVQVHVQGGDALNAYLPTYYQEGQTLRIECHYRKGGGANATQFWVNGNLVATEPTSDAGDVTGFNLGMVASLNNGLGAGTELLFDEVKVSTTYLGVGTRGDVGITMEADSSTVQDIEVRNTNQYLIKLRNCQRTKVLRNYLHDSNQAGIIANIGGGNHLIDSNDISLTGGDLAAYGEGSGVQFLATTTGVNVVSGNYIHHCGDEAGDHGVYSEGGVNLITGNRFYRVSGFAVKCRGGSAGSMVSRNRMEFCRTGMVHAENAETTTPLAPVKIYHNSGYQCGTYPAGLSPYTAFWVTGYGRASIANNVASGSGAGITVDGSNADVVTCDYNDLSGTLNFGYWKTAFESTLSDWRTASGHDAHTLESDPLFTDPDAGDLTLQAGSPARNAGVAIAGINDGYLGAAPDLGYIEMS